MKPIPLCRIAFDVHDKNQRKDFWCALFPTPTTPCRRLNTLSNHLRSLKNFVPPTHRHCRTARSEGSISESSYFAILLLPQLYSIFLSFCHVCYLHTHPTQSTPVVLFMVVLHYYFLVTASTRTHP